MSQAKEIRSKISSIKSTQKITSAMELVAASKMRKAQDRMALSRPYAHKINQVISHVAQSSSEYNHPYMRHPEKMERVGLMIVSSDRGLCGGLNVLLFRSVLQQMTAWRKAGIEVDLCLIGRKAETFFKRLDCNIIGVTTHLGDAPRVQDLIGIVTVMLNKFDEGKLDALHIAYNQFINTMKQQPIIQQLLPLHAEDKTEAGHWDYIYEPDSARVLLDYLLRRYVESQVYQSVVENNACFQAAQMVAMKSATDNANDLIGELQKIYNKTRQAAITREIAEIVSGAAAIE